MDGTNARQLSIEIWKRKTELDACITVHKLSGLSLWRVQHLPKQKEWFEWWFHLAVFVFFFLSLALFLSAALFCKRAPKMQNAKYQITRISISINSDNDVRMCVWVAFFSAFHFIHHIRTHALKMALLEMARFVTQTMAKPLWNVQEIATVLFEEMCDIIIIWTFCNRRVSTMYEWAVLSQSIHKLLSLHLDCVFILAPSGIDRERACVCECVYAPALTSIFFSLSALPFSYCHAACNCAVHFSLKAVGASAVAVVLVPILFICPLKCQIINKTQTVLRMQCFSDIVNVKMLWMHYVERFVVKKKSTRESWQ